MAASSENAWIHCNQCYELYIKKERRFFLFSCHHIACVNCVPPQPGATGLEAATFNCLRCGSAVRGREINNSMPPQLKQLFHPNLCAPNLPSASIFNFQQKHRQHLDLHLAKLRKQVREMQHAFEEERFKIKKKHELLMQLKQEGKSLERKVRGIMNERNGSNRSELPYMNMATDSGVEDANISPQWGPKSDHS